MKRGFAWLFPLGAITVLLSFPWPWRDPFSPPIAVVLIGLLVYAGLWFGAPLGLGSSIPSLRRVLYSLLIGTASGGVVLAMLPLAGLQSRIIEEASIPLWKWLIIAFDSSVLEELIFRLFIVSFMAWICWRVLPPAISIRIALVLSALAFGVVHLGRWIHQGPVVIAAVLIVNGIIAIVLGLVYVKWGIESAIVAHFAGDVVVHIIGPQFFV